MIGRLKRLWRRLRGKDLDVYLKAYLVPGDGQRSSMVLETLRQTNLIAAEECNGPEAGPVLVIAPHPDDEAIGPGGTLIRLVERGLPVTVVFLTDGSVLPESAARRRQEAEASVARIGCRARFLGFPPDAIPLAAAEVLAEVVAEERPAAVMIPFVLDDNDDHRRANQLLLALSLPKAVQPTVWAYQVYTALPVNRVVDITAVADGKVEAIRCHASQMARRDWAHFALGLNAVNIRMIRKPEARYVEAFLALPMDRYQDLCRDYFQKDARPCYLGERYRSRTGA